MLQKGDGLLNFTQPAVDLERRVRAMYPWPGAWFEWNGNPLKVLRASTVSGEKGLASGSRFTVEGRPAVQSSEGALVLDEVQPAGKKAMPGKSFLAGARDWVAGA
jgi:methionyl-tRNA formyltransferase